MYIDPIHITIRKITRLQVDCTHKWAKKSYKKGLFCQENAYKCMTLKPACWPVGQAIQAPITSSIQVECSLSSAHT